MTSSHVIKLSAFLAVLVTGGLMLSHVSTIQAQDAAKPAKFVLKGDKANGEILFKENCAPCHGEKGDGKSEIAKHMKPRPRNFTRKRMTAKNIYTAVKKGGEAIGKSQLMPPWGYDLEEQQLQDVTVYVMSLRGRKH